MASQTAANQAAADDQITGRQKSKALTSTRIETLVDGVFAIAMTLLVLDIKVPREITRDELWPAIAHLWPQFGAYIVSFLVLAVYWIGHHYQFHWIKRTDRALLWINVFFLMSIAFVPFSTALLAEYNHERTAVLLYGINVIFSGLMLYFHLAYAAGKGRLTDNSLTEPMVKNLKFRIMVGIAFYVVATLLAHVSTIISLVLFALLPILYMRTSRLDRTLKADA